MNNWRGQLRLSANLFQNGHGWAPENGQGEIIPEEVRPREVLHVYYTDNAAKSTGPGLSIPHLQGVLGVPPEALHSLPVDQIPQVSDWIIS